jgi:hypothetical protein
MIANIHAMTWLHKKYFENFQLDQKDEQLGVCFL